MRKNWLISTLSASVVCLSLCSCATLWNLGNVSSFQTDVENILKNAGVETKITTAHMVDTTRAAVAEFAITADDFKKVVSALQLEKAERIPSDFKGNDSPILESYLKGGAENIEAYSTTTPRPGSLKLSSGSSFEYAVLLYDSRAGKACLLTCYAYG